MSSFDGDIFFQSLVFKIGPFLFFKLGNYLSLIGHSLLQFSYFLKKSAISGLFFFIFFHRFHFSITVNYCYVKIDGGCIPTQVFWCQK